MWGQQKKEGRDGGGVVIRGTKQGRIKGDLLLIYVNMFFKMKGA